MELLDLYQLRMDKCAAEQFWAMAMIAAMNGFVLLHTKRLLKAINKRVLIAGILIITLLFCGYIISRHFIYVHYDSLANNLIRQMGEGVNPIFQDKGVLWKELALWSGVSFYTLITVGSCLLSVLYVSRMMKK